MAIESAAEIELLRESCRWDNLAHTLLRRYTRVGATKTEIETRAANEATAAMLDAIGPRHRAQSSYSSGASAGCRGQIGRNAAILHAHGNNIAFRTGDVLVTGVSARVWGYHSELERELERTMAIGAPTDDQRRHVRAHARAADARDGGHLAGSRVRRGGQEGVHLSRGAFRHSDTIAVTEDDVEWLTYYPRDLEAPTLNS